MRARNVENSHQWIFLWGMLFQHAILWGLKVFHSVAVVETIVRISERSIGPMVAFIMTMVCPFARGDLSPASFSGTPVDSWKYSQLLNAGHGQSTTYYATTYAEYENAALQGYITYNHDTPADSFYGDAYDSIQVFGTYLESKQNQQLTIHFGGDDGSSLFVNGQFVGGGGFGATTYYTLDLHAGVPMLIDLVGYNGPGNWVFGIYAPNEVLLNDVPGLSLNADGQFQAVPEPSALLTASLGVFAFIAYGWSRSRRLAH